MKKLTLAATVVAIAGVACLAIVARNPAYVDSNGILVEPFVWMVTGRLLLAAAVAIAVLRLAQLLLARARL